MRKYRVTKYGEYYGLLTVPQIVKLTRTSKETVIELLHYGMPIRDYWCTPVEELNMEELENVTKD